MFANWPIDNDQMPLLPFSVNHRSRSRWGRIEGCAYALIEHSKSLRFHMVIEMFDDIFEGVKTFGKNQIFVEFTDIIPEIFQHLVGEGRFGFVRLQVASLDKIHAQPFVLH